MARMRPRIPQNRMFSVPVATSNPTHLQTYSSHPAYASWCSRHYGSCTCSLGVLLQLQSNSPMLNPAPSSKPCPTRRESRRPQSLQRECHPRFVVIGPNISQLPLIPNPCRMFPLSQPSYSPCRHEALPSEPSTSLSTPFSHWPHSNSRSIPCMIPPLT